MTAKDEVTVFVNYVGLWSDMDIGPNRRAVPRQSNSHSQWRMIGTRGTPFERRRSSSHILSRMTIGLLDPTRAESEPVGPPRPERGW